MTRLDFCSFWYIENYTLYYMCTVFIAHSHMYRIEHFMLMGWPVFVAQCYCLLAVCVACTNTRNSSTSE